jgi:ubiquinone biosynthesis protein COQ9
MPARKANPDAALKLAVLDAALSHAATDGFTGNLLAEAAKEAGVSTADIARLFPQAALSLLEFYSLGVDAEMEKRLRDIGLAAMPVRQRISTAVKTRLAIVKPNKDAARRAAAYLSLPPNLPLAARLVYRTVDCMWHAAGDRSTDFNFYTKRGILAGVYTSTLMRWFTDASPDERETEAFLAARIENVLQYEKLKARMRREANLGLDRMSELLRHARR